MLIASINYSLSLGYALCFLLTGLFAASLLQTYRNLSGISLVRIESQPVFAGSHLTFTLTLENPSGLKRNGIQIRSGTDACSINIPARAKATTELKIRSESRGSYRLKRLTLTSDFPLGLWFTWSYAHPKVAQIVFPKPERNAPPLPQQLIIGSGDRHDRRSAGDIDGIRAYQIGDNLSAIAWKLAARGQGLFARNFEEEASARELLMSLDDTSLPTLEQQIERLTAWVLAADQSDSVYGLSLLNNELPLSRGPEHRHNSLELLAMYGQP